MNTKTILNIKTEKKLKAAAQEIADELGVPLSTAINAFLRQFVRDRELVISASEKPSSYLREVMHASQKERASKKTAGPFHTTEELLDSLDA